MGRYEQMQNRRRVWAAEDEKRGEPMCCRGVVPEPRVVGGRPIEGWREGLCPKGCHRVVISGGRRSVYDRRTGDPNATWEGPAL